MSFSFGDTNALNSNAIKWIRGPRLERADALLPSGGQRMADSGTYYARLLPLRLNEIGLRSLVLAGQTFTPDAGYLPVPQDIAAQLAAIHRVEHDPSTPLALRVLAP